MNDMLVTSSPERLLPGQDENEVPPRAQRDLNRPGPPEGREPRHLGGKSPRAGTGVSRASRLARLLAATGKSIATLAIVMAALLVAIVTWQSYVLAPWTRNGSIRVQVANVAPQVSGQIIELLVSDNQYVQQGEPLYVIDPINFEIARDVSIAQVAQAAADLELKEVESKRRQSLSNLSTSREEQQIYAAAAAEAKAAFSAAQQRQAQAELDLKRTRVLSPVTGYVTNLLLRVGDFAITGNSNVTIIDAGSYWIDGYFEETKMGGVCVNDRVDAQLMGYSTPIVGHVETITRGISVSNATVGAQGLPNVDPVYTWVRLAQRVPVRIAIDEVPSGVPLVSGMTATVTIRQRDDGSHLSLLERGYAIAASSIMSLLSGPPPSRPGCLPVMTHVPAQDEALPVPVEPPEESAEKVAPGIAPGLNASPKLVD